MADETTSATEDHEEQPDDESKQESPYLQSTESKQEMANALTSLISTFKHETEQQDQILVQLQNEATNNANFGTKSHASQWTVNEVCYWLTTIDLLDYINVFYSSNIDGNILFNDINQNLLTNELNVKPIHCSKILREIDNLKNPSLSSPWKADADTSLNDIIATIKKENEVLLSELETQKELNKELSSTSKQTDFHSISNDKHMNGIKTNSSTKSLSDVVETQNKMIKDLTKQLAKLENNTTKKMRELKNKNKKLQDGYIQIETHYQTQLQHSRTKSKNLAAQLSNINSVQNDNNISLLWSENEHSAKDLENEKEKRMMLEMSLKSAHLSLNNERQKRELLESQTSRLTAELTKYLSPSIDNKRIINSKKERFARFKSIKKRRNTTDISYATNSESNVECKENNNKNNNKNNGWQKFLNAAGSVGNKMKNKEKEKENNNKTRKTGKSFHLPKQLSLTNIQEKLGKKADTSNRNDENMIKKNSIDEDKEISDDIEMDIDDFNKSINNSNDDRKHARKATLGETVMKTFKKIQSATKAKMEERAHKKQIKRQSITDIKDIIKAEDRFYISKDDDNKNDNKNNNNKVNIYIDNDDEYSIEDEDSSAAEQEYEMRKRLNNKHTKIIITKPNKDNVINEHEIRDSDDSIIIRGDEISSPTNMEIQFVPAMEALKQTHEQELDTDASF